jgi:hypothetical protein
MFLKELFIGPRKKKSNEKSISPRAMNTEKLAAIYLLMFTSHLL